MKNVKRTISAIILCGTLCLSGCGGAENEPETTTEPLAETTVEATVETTAETTVESKVARIVEVPYEGGTAVFEFNEKDLLVAEKNRPWGGSNKHYTYDKENRITEISYANYDGTVDEYCERVTYEYNVDGKIKKINVYNLQENILVRYFEYEYEDGLLTKIDAYQRNQGKYVKTYSDEYYYNEKGLKIRSRNVADDGSYGENFYTYDDKGRLILEEYSQGAGSTEYVYDESGKIIKEVHGIDEMELVYEYENGVLAKTVWVKDEFNSEQYSNEGSYTEYKYYDNGNIVARYHCDKNGEIGEINIDAIPEVKGNYSDDMNV